MIHLCLCDDDVTILKPLQEKVSAYITEKKLDCSIHIYTDSRALYEDITHEIHYDIYLLDIIMPSMSGIHLAHEIRSKDSSAIIIFLTSSTEYALTSYEVHASAYLIKPFTDAKLIAVLDDAILTYEEKTEKNLLIQQNSTIKSIPCSSIVYIEVYRNKLYFYLKNQSKCENYGTLSELMQSIPKSAHFIQVHRSYLVNLSYISEISSKQIRLSPDYYVPVSKSYLSSLKQAYFEYMED